MKKFFVTGTDTDVGKTFVTRLLLAKAKQSGFKAIAIKPVSAGSDDAILLQKDNSLLLPNEVVNPIYLQNPLSPHIAAAKENKQLTASSIYSACQAAMKYPVDYFFVEGAGGWLVPINRQETMADLAMQFNIPVILIVNMRLGCLNHALLTIENILSKQLTIAGFIANQSQAQTQEAFSENVATLQQRIKAPLLGVVPYSINKDISLLSDLLTLP